jgi:aminoglycoside phosphotransferase family enzyme/predicted kinase
MDLPRLVEALSDPSADPGPAGPVEVRQTHISVVFLAGDHAYKVKKPVRLSFLDFSTLDKRRHFCEEEVRLNRRLAPGVYLGVVPVTANGGRVRVEGPGEPVEWAVKMTRLPEGATLRDRLRRGEVGTAEVEALARRVAAFHRAAAGGPRAAAFAGFATVARNARENLDHAGRHVGATLSLAVYRRLRGLTETTLAFLRPRIEGRAERGVARDTHGDLHLDHVYLFPGRPPPDDLVVVDCIEFNERYRFADPVADMAFLVMDLRFCGRDDLARAFADAYFAASGDKDGRALLPLYTAYRAAVRGKVEGIELSEKEIPETGRADAGVRARAHWLLALGELEAPRRRPCLVLLAGLPGTGKSTLAGGLAAQAGFRVVRSDVVRKELAGASPPPAAGFDEGLYAPEWTERTYAECLRRAEALLFEGERVAVDAGFREEARRRTFLKLAGCMAVPALVLVCRASPDVVRSRLEHRRGGASDADWAVHLRLAERWEEPGPDTRPRAHDIRTEGDPVASLDAALDVLREARLL